MTAPDNWGEQVAPRDVHTPPSEVQGAQLPSQDQMFQWGQKLIEGIVRRVVQLVTGILLPGPAGTQLTTWATGIFDKFGNISNLFGGANLASGSLNLSSVWSSVVTAFINPLGFFANLVSGFLPNSQLGGHDASKITSGTFANGFIPGLGNTLDDIFGGFMRLGTTSGATNSQAREAIDGTSSSLVNTNATVAQILAALGPGNVDADDFERTGSTPGSSWDLYSTGTGTVGTPNGHDLAVGGSADFEFVMRRNTTVADDDGMESSIILGTAPESSPFLFPSEYGCNDVWIRLGTFTTWATRTGVRLRYQANKTLRVDAFVSGTGTTILSPVTIPAPAAGASLTIESVGATRTFNIRCGGYSTSFTESGSTSQVGASYRRRGLGGRTENTLLATAHPGTFKQWTGQG